MKSTDGGAIQSNSDNGYWASHIFKSEEYVGTGICEMIPYVVNHYCPHCGSNSGSLQREFDDIFCLMCGYRWSCYYNLAMERWIQRQWDMDEIYGDESETVIKLPGDKNKTRAESSRDYFKRHREEKKAYDATRKDYFRWYEKNKRIKLFR